MIVKISSLFKLFLLNATSPAIESTILSTVSWLNLSFTSIRQYRPLIPRKRGKSCKKGVIELGVVVIDEESFRKIVREELQSAIQHSRPPEELKPLSLKQAANFFGIGTEKCYELTRRKGFPVLRDGNRILIPREGLRRWLEEEASKNPRGMECLTRN